MPEPPEHPDDEARAVLRRELYWAGDPTDARSGTTAELRIALQDFVAVLRADERSPIPRQEPLLGSQTPWKRNTKLLIYRAIRPVSRRYDRLLGDLATLTRTLADRLADAEAEIERLRTGPEYGRGPAGAPADARTTAAPGGPPSPERG